MIVYFSSLENKIKNRLDMHQTDLGMFIQIQIHPISILFLDLAKYLLNHPDLLQEGSSLFPGDSQYERFVKIFTKLFAKTKKSLRNWE